MADVMKAPLLVLLLTSVLVCWMTISAPAHANPLLEMPTVTTDHPRLGFRPATPPAGKPAATPHARTFSFVRELYQRDETFRSYFLPAVKQAEEDMAESPGDPLLQAACWVATGEERFALAGVEALQKAELLPTKQSSYYSSVWQFALAYDWLFNHPAMTDEVKRSVEKRIGDVLESELRDLDGGYSVVWHGRTQLANNTFVAALALSLDPRAEEFQRRALVHYADAVRALELAEGWPEGTSYWIHNRAFPFALAADCYITATGGTAINGMDVREGIRRVALWQLYSLQPDLSFARYGDCWADGLIAGPGLWQPAVDYYARLTGDPVVVAISDLFRARSRRQYHAGRYGWSAVLAYDPTIAMPEGYDREQPEAYLNAHLPQSYLCGRHTLGEAFLTEGWGEPDATYITFKAGDVMAHHGHYDQGSFTIFCGSPLAVHSGSYADYFSPYRLGYFVQSVSKNTLLVHAPGEFGNFSRRAGNYDPITGGQRSVMPSGSHIVCVDDWFNNLYRGRHYAAGEILAFESVPGVLDYLSADLTRAYNSTLYAEPGNAAKVSAVTRKLLYLREPKAVVVFDRVVTTDARYRTEWLLHTPAKPASASERQVEGEPEDGILATDDRWLSMSYEKGQLFVQSLLPEQARLLKIGGPSYHHYIETDEGGANLEPSGRHREEPESYGRWRMQISDEARQEEHLFLHVLWPRPTGSEAPAPARLVSRDEGRVVVSLADWVVVLSVSGWVGERDGSVSYQAPPGTRHHLVADLPGRSTWEVTTSEGAFTRIASVEGVIAFDAGEGEVTLTLVPEEGKGGYQ